MVHLGKEEVLELLRYSRVSIVPHQKKKIWKVMDLDKRLGSRPIYLAFGSNWFVYLRSMLPPS